MRVHRMWLAAAAVSIGQPLAAAPVQDGAILAAPALTDAELAELTGKFLLPGGVEVALTVTSDTLLNGQAVLRTVLAVDNGSTLSVFGRSPDAPASVSAAGDAASRPATAAGPTGISVAFDRHSGIQTITPTWSAAVTPGVTVGGAGASDSAAQGLERLTVAAGGPAVRTPDGVVTVQTLANGSLVSLAGDQLQASHLVGQSIATALLNSGNDRTFDTVTNIAVDLRNVAPYQIGAAAMRADTLALEATRSMIR